MDEIVVKRGRPRRSSLTRQEQLAAAQRAYRARQRERGLVAVQVQLPETVVAAINRAIGSQPPMKRPTRDQIITRALSEKFLRQVSEPRKK